jgi:transcriptional regulator GlxA family with amidase domain
VFARLPNATTIFCGLHTSPVRDMHGLRLQCDVVLEDAPQLDLPQVPGGFGQEALMETGGCSTGWPGRPQARTGCSPCAGVLLLGAAGLLRGQDEAQATQLLMQYADRDGPADRPASQDRARCG